jgi:hypothetical protein
MMSRAGADDADERANRACRSWRGAIGLQVERAAGKELISAPITSCWDELALKSLPLKLSAMKQGVVAGASANLPRTAEWGQR